MSFLKRLFGGGGGGESEGTEPARAKVLESRAYKGYRIDAAPEAEGGQFRVAGFIVKEVDGEERTHRVVRADLLPSAEAAADTTFMKAERMIDEQGDRLFAL